MGGSRRARPIEKVQFNLCNPRPADTRIQRPRDSRQWWKEVGEHKGSAELRDSSNCGAGRAEKRASMKEGEKVQSWGALGGEMGGGALHGRPGSNCGNAMAERFGRWGFGGEMVGRLGRSLRNSGGELEKGRRSWVLGEAAGRDVAEEGIGSWVSGGEMVGRLGSSLRNSGGDLEKARSWVLGEDAGKDGMQRRRKRGRRENREPVFAARSLEDSRRGLAASTAAIFEDLRGRRKGAIEAGDGSVESVSLGVLLRHPIAMVSLVPKGLSLFLAGAVAGAAAKTVTAPLDRVKLLMQVQGAQAAQAGVRGSFGFVDAFTKIGTEEGVRGYWKGNLPQVIRVIPYSAVQLVAYETYKRILKGSSDELPVWKRLAAGACAGMTSTLVTYPLDTLRLRMAIDPASKRMSEVIVSMMRQEGPASFYCGLGPSLLGIAPYIALNFCVFDLVKNSLPEDVRKRPEASLVTALASATFATTMCYPLDTVRRQLQMKGTPFRSVADAFSGIIARDGLLGLYRGFVPNALKNLPSSSIRLTTFDAAKNLISASQLEYDRLLNRRLDKSNPQDRETDGIPRD